jgi:hypothetical protein
MDSHSLNKRCSWEKQEPNNPQVSRRDILKVGSVFAGGLAMNRLGDRLEPPLAQGNEDELSAQIYLPMVANNSPSRRGAVVHVHAPNATSWTGQSRYWEHVEQPVVDLMVESGVIALTGALNIQDAWRVLMPHYQPGQKIAIKVNFNNCWNCSSTLGVIDALIHPVNALVTSLGQIGVSPDDVFVYDAVRALPNRFTGGGIAGIRYFDKYCNSTAGFSSHPEAYIPFDPPPGVIMPAERITDVVLNADYLINMPIMKGGHPLAGVTLGFKNHFGTIHNCAELHDYVDAVSKPPAYDRDYNPMIDFYRNPHIGGKTVLNIGDGLFAAKDFNNPPEIWDTFGGKVPNSLFFSTDPVAIDCVLHDFIAAEMGNNLTPAANRYLVLAGNAGLGVYESVNPWTGSYSQIIFTKKEL